MSATNSSGLNHVRTYNDIARNSFLIFMINSSPRVMIHTSEEQKVNGKHIILTYELVREQNAFI